MAIIHTEDEGPNELLNRRAKSSGGCVQASQAPHFHGNPDTDHKPNNLDPASTAVPGSKPNPVTTIYEGYKFFKADPIPGQKATWTRVERTQMHLSQSELYKLVQKRANKISPAQQYQGLSRTRRAHVNQLIHEQRRCEPQVEWSCVYAKERLAHRDDYGTVSMDIVLMKRPMRTKPYPRTPMGDLVDLNVPFRLDENDAYQINHERTNTAALPKLIAPRFHTVPSNFWAQEGEPGRVVQGPLPCPVPVTSPFTKLGLEQGKAAEALNRRNANSSHENATNEQINLDHDTKGWSSEASSDDDDDGSMLFDPSQSDVSSTTEESDVRKRESGCEEPSQPSHPRPSNWRRPPSPNHADPDFLCRRDLKGRNGEEIDRRLPLRPYNPDMIAAKNALCAKRDWSQCAGNEDSELWEKRYRIQRMDDEELRNRLLDCEASIERWERAFNRQTLILQSTVEETRQLKRSRSFWDFSSMRHCGCDCPRNGNMGNTG